MHESIDQFILEQVNLKGTIDTHELSKELQKDHQLYVGAVKRLQSLGKVRYFSSLYCLSNIPIISKYYFMFPISKNIIWNLTFVITFIHIKVSYSAFNLKGYRVSYAEYLRYHIVHSTSRDTVFYSSNFGPFFKWNFTDVVLVI